MTTGAFKTGFSAQCKTAPSCYASSFSATCFMKHATENASFTIRLLDIALAISFFVIFLICLDNRLLGVSVLVSVFLVLISLPYKKFMFPTRKRFTK